MRSSHIGMFVVLPIFCMTLVSKPTLLRAEPASRGAERGPFVSLGGGWGSFARSGCAECSRTGGPSAYLEFGAAVSQRVRLGLITTAWMKREDPSTTVAAGNASGAITFFAQPGGGLYARFGLGLGTYIIDGEVETGFGILAGVGYEFRPSGWFAAGPYLNWYRGNFDPFSTDVAQVGIALTAR